MSLPFQDQTPEQYEQRQRAEADRQHLRLVHDEVSGKHSAEELQRLGTDIAEGTDSINLLIDHLVRTSKTPPTCWKRVRDFIDAIIGLTAGSNDYVEMKDELIASRMGCGVKTVQNARKDFRLWPDHSTLILIKDDYRTPEGEAHAHRYLCRITRLAAEATLNARISSGYGINTEKRREALSDAARLVADSEDGFPAPAPRRRRKPTDSEMVVRELKQARDSVARAAGRQPMARRVNLDEVETLRDDLVARLKELEIAYGLESAFTTLNTNTEERVVSPSPDASDLSRRVEDETGGLVVTDSIKNESTESTTYENQADENSPEIHDQPDPPPDELTAMYAAEVRAAIARKISAGMPEPEAIAEVEDEIGEFEEWDARRKREVWERLTSGLRGGADGNTN
jgi:hypothetical protein